MPKNQQFVLNETRASTRISFTIPIQQLLLQRLCYLHLYLYSIRDLINLIQLKVIYRSLKSSFIHYLPEAVLYCSTSIKLKHIDYRLLFVCFVTLLQIAHTLPLAQRQKAVASAIGLTSYLTSSDSSIAYKVNPLSIIPTHQRHTHYLISKQIQQQRQGQGQQPIYNLLRLAEQRQLQRRLRKRDIGHINKMNECNSQPVFLNPHQQINASLQYMENLFNDYLKAREGKTYKDMLELWSLHDLQLCYAYPEDLPKSKQPLHNEMLAFHLRMHSLSEVVNDVINDTNANRSVIDHAEQFSALQIREFFQRIRREVHRIMMENESVLKGLSVAIPNLLETTVDYNRNLNRKVRDFFIVHQLLEEVRSFYGRIWPQCIRRRTTTTTTSQKACKRG